MTSQQMWDLLVVFLMGDSINVVLKSRVLLEW